MGKDTVACPIPRLTFDIMDKETFVGETVSDDREAGGAVVDIDRIEKVYR